MWVVKQSTFDAVRAQLADAHRTLVELGAADLQAVRRKIAEEEKQLTEVQMQRESVEGDLATLRSELVRLQDEAVLQEVGLYRFSHPMADSVQYKAALAEIDAHIKDLVKADSAISAAADWRVNNSVTEGRRMLREVSRLMLAAYNAEVENVLRTLRPHRLQAAVDRIEKLQQRIERNGKTMQIRITPEYHRLRLDEVRMTADYLQKLDDEREAMRAERERLRDAQRAEREMEAEQGRLEREADKYRTAIPKMIADGKTEEVDALRSELSVVEDAIAKVIDRSANIRAGFVYVISNIGSFGEDVVKIGLTRRLDPEERIRELSEASVPFNFDKHAIIFSNDAVGLEGRLHNHFADRRLNRVNVRREFFRVSPLEVRDALQSFEEAHLTEFRDLPDAVEWRQSAAGIRIGEPAT